jgi:predicted CoA-substrate-specific enzyme activase
MKTLHKALDISDGIWNFAPAKPVIGLDLGSRGSKGVLIIGDEIFTVFIPTGLFMQETADELVEKLLDKTGLERVDLGYIVGTGYGRISLAFDDVPFEVVTEISCHAMGAHSLHPKARTVIDIGGQDSKAIKIDIRNGKVIEFVMNDKCAAGTGRFLEKAAALLGIDLETMGTLALHSIKPASISSQCVVFAESEMISIRAKAARNNDKEATANISAGIHHSAARRVRNLLSRVGNEPELIFTGGVSKNPGMRKILEELIGVPFTPTRFDMMFAGALGAAVYASQYAMQVKTATQNGYRPTGAGLVHITSMIEQKEEDFIESRDGRKKIGYFCAYTPIEILSAANCLHARLFKAGKPETVAAGELITQSVFCDFSKSCLGGFVGGEGAIPLYRSLDKVYNFHTCGSMKRMTEVLENYVPVKLLNLPRIRNNPDSREYFRSELLHFKGDVEKLTGSTIEENTLRQRIAAYNEVRFLIKQFSELRKRNNVPLTGSEFLELVRGFYLLEPEENLPAYRNLYQQLAAQADGDSGKLRMMIAGSIVGDGDRRLLDIVEKELGLSVVVEDHCTGLKPFYGRIDETIDPYLALANGYLDQAPCARMKPIVDSLNFTEKLAREYDVDGVLFVYQKFCGIYGIAKKEFLDRFQSLNIPVLDISGDYSESDHGQIKTRIEAFVEVLQSQRSAER